MPSYKINRIALYVSAFFVVILVLFAIFRDNANDITLQDAKKILQNHTVKDVAVTQDYVYLKTKDNLYRLPSSQVNPKMFADYKVKIKSATNVLVYILYAILFLGVGGILFRWWQKKQPLLHAKEKESFSDMPSAPIEPIKSDIGFSDIGGISEVKVELEEIIDFMKNPKRYKDFGARMPKGVLLVGPPGVGKTMIAKAVAKEADVPFYYQSGASFVQIYVGMGAKRVHELFRVAKNNAPSIIFIDEIDAVGKKRDGQRNDEREATLNQLLTEMDGFENSSGVIVIAATNKIDILDSALLRAGRFDRRIFVELPTKKERESILLKYLKKVPNNVDAKAVANMTVGFNGASLAALVNEAALLSLRQRDFQINMEHLHQVKDKVLFGKKKIKVLNEEQKKYKITYQAGKALVAAYYDLSFEKLMLSNEKLMPSIDDAMIESELEARIQMLLGGMVACDMKYEKHTSEAKNDLLEAKEIAKNMLEQYGMGEKFIYTQEEHNILMDKLYKHTLKLLHAKIDALQKIENILFERESITKKEILELIG